MSILDKKYQIYLAGKMSGLSYDNMNQWRLDLSHVEHSDFIIVNCEHLSTSTGTNLEIYDVRRWKKTMVKVKIKYFDDNIERLAYIDGKSDWIDLRAVQDTTLKQGEFTLIPLGVAMKLPEGFEAHIVPRSSTYKNYGIIQTNGIGIIDNSYCGDSDQWMMPVYATRDTKIHKNDRICQFRVIRNQPEIIFDEVKELGVKECGEFESTGKQ